MRKEHNQLVEKPWGRYTIIHQKPNYQVKELIVAPSGKLSEQRHRNRIEMWSIVKGNALVYRDFGEDHLIATAHVPGNTIRINNEQWHSLENVTDEELIVIETQLGDYAESNIERRSDKYGRC